MKQPKQKKKHPQPTIIKIEDSQSNLEQIYDPFVKISFQDIRRYNRSRAVPTREFKSRMALFTDEGGSEQQEFYGNQNKSEEGVECTGGTGGTDCVEQSNLNFVQCKQGGIINKSINYAELPNMLYLPQVEVNVMKEINMNLSKSTDPKCSSSNKIKKYNICSVNMYNDDAKKNNKIMQVQKQAQIQIQTQVQTQIQVQNLNKAKTKYNKSIINEQPEPSDPKTLQQQIIKDKILQKIIQRKNNPKKSIKSHNQTSQPDKDQDKPQHNNNISYKYNYNYKKYEQDDYLYGFNTNFRVAYPQTPGFKSLLHSPFGKFNHLFKDVISTINRQNFQISCTNNPYSNNIDHRLNFEQLQLSISPLQFYNKSKSYFQASKYFIGMALKLKQQKYIPQCLYLCNLACYAEPFNDKPWRKYIAILQEQGKLTKACILAKTGFLLTQSQQLIKLYLSIGQKCSMQLYKLQGIMCSISCPEQFQKTLLIQSIKLQLKYGHIWKGLKLLWQICKANDYRLSVCLHTLYLARYLQNIGFPDKAMYILKQSFSKSMSKLQIYLLYLQISLRKNKYLVQADLQEVIKYIDYISGENRYRMWLEIAQIMYKNNDQRFYVYIGNAYKAVVEFCAPGTGMNKGLKHIYYTVAKLKGTMPNVKNCISDTIIFELNRYKFINGQELIQYQFQDWKYYLHYGIRKRYDLLIQAGKKWPLTGRIIAQWIHCMRLYRRPLQILKIWRNKINQVPKSGQLWCEGGRIYASLGQFSNAEKCFRCAMHFTPQYGDSFIQELKLLLKDGRFLEIQKLKRLFLASQPFYGHVLSYLKQNHWYTYSINLNQLWENAVYQICQDLYKYQNKNKTDSYNYKPLLSSEGAQKNTEIIQARLFTAYPPYNNAFINQNSREQRIKLFNSYQQMDNKN